MLYPGLNSFANVQKGGAKSTQGLKPVKYIKLSVGTGKYTATISGELNGGKLLLNESLDNVYPGSILNTSIGKLVVLNKDNRSTYYVVDSNYDVIDSLGKDVEITGIEYSHKTIQSAIDSIPTNLVSENIIAQVHVNTTVKESINISGHTTDQQHSINISGAVLGSVTGSSNTLFYKCTIDSITMSNSTMNKCIVKDATLTNRSHIERCVLSGNVNVVGDNTSVSSTSSNPSTTASPYPDHIKVSGSQDGSGPGGVGNADGVYTFIGGSMGQGDNVYKRGSDNMWIARVVSEWIITWDNSPGHWTDSCYHANSLSPVTTAWVPTTKADPNDMCGGTVVTTPDDGSGGIIPDPDPLVTLSTILYNTFTGGKLSVSGSILFYSNIVNCDVVGLSSSEGCLFKGAPNVGVNTNTLNYTTSLDGYRVLEPSISEATKYNFTVAYFSRCNTDINDHPLDSTVSAGAIHIVKSELRSVGAPQKNVAGSVTDSKVTFSTAQPSLKRGQYITDGTSKAYLSSKISDTEWYVVDGNGGTSQDISGISDSNSTHTTIDLAVSTIDSDLVAADKMVEIEVHSTVAKVSAFSDTNSDRTRRIVLQMNGNKSDEIDVVCDNFEVNSANISNTKYGVFVYGGVNVSVKDSVITNVDRGIVMDKELRNNNADSDVYGVISGNLITKSEGGAINIVDSVHTSAVATLPWFEIYVRSAGTLIEEYEVEVSSNSKGNFVYWSPSRVEVSLLHNSSKPFKEFGNPWGKFTVTGAISGVEFVKKFKDINLTVNKSSDDDVFISIKRNSLFGSGTGIFIESKPNRDITSTAEVIDNIIVCSDPILPIYNMTRNVISSGNIVDSRVSNPIGIGYEYKVLELVNPSLGNYDLTSYDFGNFGNVGYKDYEYSGAKYRSVGITPDLSYKATKFSIVGNILTFDNAISEDSCVGDVVNGSIVLEGRVTDKEWIVISTDAEDVPVTSIKRYYITSAAANASTDTGYTLTIPDDIDGDISVLVDVITPSRDSETNRIFEEKLKYSITAKTARSINTEKTITAEDVEECRAESIVVSKKCTSSLATVEISGSASVVNCTSIKISGASIKYSVADTFNGLNALCVHMSDIEVDKNMTPLRSAWQVINRGSKGSGRDVYGKVVISDFIGAVHIDSEVKNMYYSVGNTSKDIKVGTAAKLKGGAIQFDNKQDLNLFGSGYVVNYMDANLIPGSVIVGELISFDTWEVFTMKGDFVDSNFEIEVTSILPLFSTVDEFFAGVKTLFKGLEDFDKFRVNMNCLVYNSSSPSDLTVPSWVTCGNFGGVNILTPIDTEKLAYKPQGHVGNLGHGANIANATISNGVVVEGLVIDSVNAGDCTINRCKILNLSSNSASSVYNSYIDNYTVAGSTLINCDILNTGSITLNSTIVNNIFRKPVTSVDTAVNNIIPNDSLYACDKNILNTTVSGNNDLSKQGNGTSNALSFSRLLKRSFSGRIRRRRFDVGAEKYVVAKRVVSSIGDNTDKVSGYAEMNVFTSNGINYGTFFGMVSNDVAAGDVVHSTSNLAFKLLERYTNKTWIVNITTPQAVSNIVSATSIEESLVTDAISANESFTINILRSARNNGAIDIVSKLPRYTRTSYNNCIRVETSLGGDDLCGDDQTSNQILSSKYNLSIPQGIMTTSNYADVSGLYSDNTGPIMLGDFSNVSCNKFSNMGVGCIYVKGGTVYNNLLHNAGKYAIRVDIPDTSIDINNVINGERLETCVMNNTISGAYEGIDIISGKSKYKDVVNIINNIVEDCKSGDISIDNRMDIGCSNVLANITSDNTTVELIGGKSNTNSSSVNFVDSDDSDGSMSYMPTMYSKPGKYHDNPAIDSGVTILDRDCFHLRVDSVGNKRLKGRWDIGAVEVQTISGNMHAYFEYPTMKADVGAIVSGDVCNEYHLRMSTADFLDTAPASDQFTSIASLNSELATRRRTRCVVINVQGGGFFTGTIDTGNINNLGVTIRTLPEETDKGPGIIDYTSYLISSTTVAKFVSIEGLKIFSGTVTPKSSILEPSIPPRFNGAVSPSQTGMVIKIVNSVAEVSYDYLVDEKYVSVVSINSNIVYRNTSNTQKMYLTKNSVTHSIPTSTSNSIILTRNDSKDIAYSGGAITTSMMYNYGPYSFNGENVDPMFSEGFLIPVREFNPAIIISASFRMEDVSKAINAGTNGAIAGYKSDMYGDNRIYLNRVVDMGPVESKVDDFSANVTDILSITQEKLYGDHFKNSMSSTGKKYEFFDGYRKIGKGNVDEYVRESNILIEFKTLDRDYTEVTDKFDTLITTMTAVLDEGKKTLILQKNNIYNSKFLSTLFKDGRYKFIFISTTKTLEVYISNTYGKGVSGKRNPINDVRFSGTRMINE